MSHFHLIRLDLLNGVEKDAQKSNIFTRLVPSVLQLTCIITPFKKSFFFRSSLPHNVTFNFHYLQADSKLKVIGPIFFKRVYDVAEYLSLGLVNYYNEIEL